MENFEIDWEEVILRLQSFTRSLIAKKGWFRVRSVSNERNKIENVYLKGKEINDYVNDAIEKYLQNPEKFDSSKGTLVNYLCFNLIRSLVNNDLVSTENKTSKDIFLNQSLTDDDDSFTYLDKILPFEEAYFDQEFDYNEVMNYIESEVKGDNIAEEIFLGVCCNGLKRREIIEEFDMSEKEYDNGMRRLKTVLNNAAIKFELKIQVL